MTKREMTIEEAIEIFKEVREEVIAKETELSKQVFENLGIKAVDLAIKVLEQQPCEDCISRKALINELKLGYFDKDLQKGKNDPCVIDAMIDWAIRTAERSPSITPSYNSIKTELEPSDDCISRAKALEMLGDEPENWTDTEKEIQEVNDYRWFKSILEDLPSVTPTITDVENNYNIGYNCGYADAMIDISEGSESE